MKVKNTSLINVRPSTRTQPVKYKVQTDLKKYAMLHKKSQQLLETLNTASKKKNESLLKQISFFTPTSSISSYF